MLYETKLLIYLEFVFLHTIKQSKNKIFHFLRQLSCLLRHVSKNKPYVLKILESKQYNKYLQNNILYHGVDWNSKQL